jgi:hypothetical protein
MPGDLAQADTDDPTCTPDELRQVKSNLRSNIALMHLQLSNGVGPGSRQCAGASSLPAQRKQMILLGPFSRNVEGIASLPKRTASALLCVDRRKRRKFHEADAVSHE